MLQVYRLLRGIDKIDYTQFFTRSQSAARGHEWRLDKPRCTGILRGGTPKVFAPFFLTLRF